MDKKEKYAIMILFALALLLRLVYVYITVRDTGTSDWDDDWYYLSMGEQIAQGNWDPVAQGRPHMVVGPVIPMIIALFIKIFGNPETPMFILNTLATALTVPVLFYLGREFFSVRTAWLTAVWALLFIEYFKFLSHLLKEPTLFLLVPLTLLLLLRSVRNNFSLRLLFLSSLSFIILIHTDERYFIYFPVFLFAFLMVRPLSVRNVMRPALTWSMLVLLMMIPWGIRNYRVMDQVVIISPRTTAITSHFWGSNLEAASSHFTNDSVRAVINEGRYGRATEFGKEYGITPHEQDIREARIQAFFNFWQPAYFRPTFIQYGFRPVKWSLAHNAAGILFYGIFLPFYLAGIIMLFRRRHYAGLFIASIPVIHSIIHAYMVWPLERYRSPVTFIIVIIGIWAFLEMTGSMMKKFNKGKYKSEIT